MIKRAPPDAAVTPATDVLDHAVAVVDSIGATAGGPVDALRESERLFRMIAGSAPTILWMDDPQGRCIYLNKTWCEFTGLAEADGLGEGWSGAVHPDDRAEFRASFLAAVAGRLPFRREYRLRRSDGQWRWVIDTATPIVGADGVFQGHIGSVIDITERRQAETALREREEIFRLAVEATDLGLWDYDVASGALVWNERLKEIYGVAPDTVVTYELYQSRVHPDDRERIRSVYQGALDPAGSGRYRFEHRTAEDAHGIVRWVQASGLVQFDPRGQPVRVLGTVREITERKAAEERQALLMAELNHRVRNILAAIQAVIQLTGHGSATKEEYAAALRGRVAAMARAHDLLTRQRWRGADLADIVREGVRAYGDAVVVEGGRGCVLRSKDALDFAFILHELATNAAKYGALSVPTGRVTIDWRRTLEGDTPMVRIRWQESGGPPVQPPARRGFGSQLIQATLRGVDLDFAPAGVRCEIALKLPQHTLDGGRGDDDTGAAAAPTAAAAQKPLRGLRVLIVEDEPMTALALRSVLEDAGADIVAVAGTLREAALHVDAEISAALLDVNLAGEMTYALAERLLSRGVPTMFVTGYDPRTALPEHLRGVPTLQKPIDEAVLVRRLAELTRERT